MNLKWKIHQISTGRCVRSLSLVPLALKVSCYRCEFSFPINVLYKQNFKKYSEMDIPEAWIPAT